MAPQTGRRREQMKKLDNANIKILSLMQENAAMTADEMAEEVGLSASAIQKRLRHLRARRRARRASGREHGCSIRTRARVTAV